MESSLGKRLQHDMMRNSRHCAGCAFHTCRSTIHALTHRAKPSAYSPCEMRAYGCGTRLAAHAHFGYMGEPVGVFNSCLHSIHSAWASQVGVTI